ncbi:MAG: PKD domain-containing protein, partial [Bacteroidia bacterium]
MNIKLRILALFLSWVGASSVFGASWYVSTSGSDSYDGTSATFVSGTTGPKKTINAAMAIASSGDVINISNGVYSETITLSKSLEFAVSSSGSSNVQVRSLHMNGSGVTLTVSGDTLDVKDTLELTLGHISTTGSKAFRTMAGAQRLGGSKNSFVKGALWIGLTSGATSLDFHIGVNQDYRYTQLNFNKTVSGLVYYRMEVKSGGPSTGGALPMGIRNISKVHYWELGLLPTGTSNNFELTASYDSVTADDQVYEANFLRILGHAPAGSWVDLGGMGSANRKGQIATNTFQTQMTFVLANVKNGVNVLGSTNAFSKFELAKGRCERDTFFFTDLSKSTASPITYWKWSFGDGNTLTYTNTGIPAKIFRKYAAYGNYTVTLIVGNSTDEDTFSYNLRVGVLPTVMFNKNIYTNGVCVGDTSLFIDTYTPPSPESIFSRKWDLGDLTTSTAQTINHIYAAGGNYKIYLTRTTALGCKAIDSLDYLVHSLPAPAINFPPGGDPICFGKT